MARAVRADETAGNGTLADRAEADMTEAVLAVLDHPDRPAAGEPAADERLAVEPSVAATATAIARLGGLDVRWLRLAGVSPREAERQVLEELRAPGTQVGVLAADGASPPLWQRVARRSAKPVVLVPARARNVARRIGRVLIPLDGTARSAAAVAATAGQFADAGVELVRMHAFDARTVPRFWDQDAHAGQAWAQEFLARNGGQPGTRLELRNGPAADQVLDVAAAEHADLIVLAWSRRLEPGHATVVRRLIRDATVPVMLLPASPG